VRSSVLAVREETYVEAARATGCSLGRIIRVHILPNVLSPLLIQAALFMGIGLLAEASLSFLGLGPPPPTASLGQMVSDSSSLAGIAWWTLVAPSIAIIIAVVGFNYLGDGLRDAADPRSRRS